MINENHIFCKTKLLGSCPRPPASVALLLGPKNYDEFFFDPLKGLKIIKT
jgi:hypothetical protein